MLAERKAVLRGAFGSYYDAPGEPFLGQLWLTFAGAPVVVLTPGEYGEGFYLEEDLREGEAIESDPEVRDLAADAPFAAVVDTALQEAGVITWKVPDKPSHRRPVGLRLQFWKADLWILYVGDEIELFDRRPPHWREYELSE
jgi:hypothetical protein